MFSFVPCLYAKVCKLAAGGSFMFSVETYMRCQAVHQKSHKKAKNIAFNDIQFFCVF